MAMDSLENVMDPELDLSVVEPGFVRKVDIAVDYLHLDIQLTSPHSPRANRMVSMTRNVVKK